MKKYSFFAQVFILSILVSAVTCLIIMFSIISEGL